MQPGVRFSRSPFQQMYVRVLQNVVCRERICISSFADASQVQIPMDGILHIQLKNKHMFVEKNTHTLPRASTLWTGFCELSGGVVSLWTRKWKSHRALSRINLDCATGSTAPYNAPYNTTRVFEHWSIFKPAFDVHVDVECSCSPATGTPVAPTADSKRNALLSALFWPFSELLRSPFRKTLPLPARFWPSGDLLSQTTLARSFLRETTVPSFFERLQHGLTFGRPLSQPSNFLYRFIFVRSL